MSHAGSTNLRRSGLSRLHFSILTLAGLLILALVVAPNRSQAAEEPFKIEFDQSNIQMGLLGSLPLDSIATGASLEGTIDENGNVKIPKGKFKMPELGLDQPIKLRGFMGIESVATGTYDRATGQLELDAKAGIWMSVDLAAILDLAGLDINDLLGGLGGSTGGINIGNLIKPLLSNLTCGFSPMDVHFTTESNSLANGARFAEGPGGTGAITAEWSQLGPLADRMTLPLIGGPCQLLRSYLPSLLEGGLGGIGGGELPIDLGGIDIAGLLSNLDNVNLGPSAITLTRSQVDLPIDPDPDPDPEDPIDPPKGSAKLKLSVTPKLRRVKAGKTTVFKIKVKNVGTAKADKVRICLTGPGKGILVRWRCNKFGSIKPGAAKVRKIKVRVNRKAQKRGGKFRFRLKSANAPEQVALRRLLVRG